MYMNRGFGMGWGMMDAMFPVVFMFAVLIIGAAIIIMLVKGIGEWHSNNQAPRLTVDAMLVAKRTHTQVRHQGGGADMHGTGAAGCHTTRTTRYYATFQVESGDRMEFLVGGREYGMLAKGDRGQLQFQGTRYLGFERLGNSSL